MTLNDEWPRKFSIVFREIFRLKAWSKLSAHYLNVLFKINNKKTSDIIHVSSKYLLYTHLLIPVITNIGNLIHGIML